ncbi:MAG: GNAT family N-acetyltransferase [Corticimicrobacter sp.]|uniref:GNAT family N-acetyltransferase n=1 Tax=Corticimicrobacter sp. TaxID=2678536 RepID=UPI0032DAF525
MIRALAETDVESVLDVWLSASVAAHDFVDPEFWRAQLENMRNLYLPAAAVYVYEEHSQVIGFYALLGDDRLAAIFVVPGMQGRGVGSALMVHAMAGKARMTLSVYKANEASVRFYQSHGFVIVHEQREEITGQDEYVMHAGGDGPHNP